MVRILLLISSRFSFEKMIREKMMELGYQLHTVFQAEAALNYLQDNPTDLFLASLEAGGDELCRELRKSCDRLPLLLLTENRESSVLQRIYHSGADGYLLFPCDPEELAFRIRSLLWRCRAERDENIEADGIVLHSASHILEAAGQTVELRRMEFLLLEKLLTYPGKIFTRFQLMDDLWGYDCESNPRTIDTHIRRLRKKIRSVEGMKIQTIRGIGYRAVLTRS